MSSVLHVKSKSKWKKLKLDKKIASGIDFSDIICVEELTDYDLISVKGNSKMQDLHNTSTETKMNPKKKKGKKKNNKNGLEKKDGLNMQNVNEIIEDESSNDLGNTNNQKSSKKRKKKLAQKTEDKNWSDNPKTELLEISEEILKLGENERKPKTKKSSSSNNCNKRKSDSETPKEGNPKKKRKLDAPSVPEVLPGMEAWKGLFVPEPVLEALKEDGFMAPTPIQSLTLPHAIRDRLDIVGAAETGSGKTLAFGIPLIHKVLQKQKKEIEVLNEIDNDDREDLEVDDVMFNFTKEDDGSTDDNMSDAHIENEMEDQDDDDNEVDDEDEDNDELPERGCVKVIDDADFSHLDPSLLLSLPTFNTTTPPLALVLEPTRELAVQVKNHLQRAARFAGIKVAPIIGGLSQQKQQRLLKKCPEVIVATPGRLWELMEQGDNYLSHVSDVSCLVVDEADRMVEKGHFEELTKVLHHINRDEEKKKKRCTMVFSATLTTIHEGPQRHIAKKKKVKLTEEKKLEMLMKKIGLKDKPKVIDLTRKLGTVETLTEAKINCTVEEKDLYLYYLLKQHPGRTLVFANSKDCIRRLISVFNLLETCPLPLHADMHQKQRLKNLERFTANEKGLLMASDVAARGLDIPDVQHVIHYQVPLTVENYVHRSGRTARVCKEGLSVMLIGQEDMRNYRKIIRSLNRSEDLPTFPVEYHYIPTLKSRVNLARHIDKTEHRQSKQKRQNDWFLKAAEEMDIAIDEDALYPCLNDLGDSHQQASQKHYLTQLKQELKGMLKQSMAPKSFSGKYPTKTGKLVTPVQPDTENGAISCVKNRKIFEQWHKKKFIPQTKGKKKWKHRKNPSNT